jgi:hypothetical protein
MQLLRRFGVAVALAVASASCGSVAQGTGPSFLVIDSLQGIRGNTTVGTPGNPLNSDVITNVISPAPCSAESPCPTLFNDDGQAIMRIVMKDAGAASPSTPSALNHITLERYHVKYLRADGRNTQGVDVPYEWDGAVRVTITDAPTTFAFQLVRSQAKDEAPLIFLRANGAVVTAIAQVTFYGRDQNGNEISILGEITVNFANFGD